MDLIINIISKEESYLDHNLLAKKEVNETFLRDQIQREQVRVNFLAEFYNIYVRGRYTNFDKVCGVREIPLETAENE